MTRDYWGDAPTESTGEYVQVTAYELIPEGTRVLAHIDTVKWDSFPGKSHQHINFKWVIDEPDDYYDMKFFQTIQVNGNDPDGQYYKPTTQDKIIESAMSMLFAIDRNAGGEIGKLRRKPTDAELFQFLAGAQMMVTLGVTPGKKQTVRGVSPNPKQTNGKPVKVDALGNQESSDYARKDELDEDSIPF